MIFIGTLTGETKILSKLFSWSLAELQHQILTVITYGQLRFEAKLQESLRESVEIYPGSLVCNVKSLEYSSRSSWIFLRYWVQSLNLTAFFESFILKFVVSISYQIIIGRNIFLNDEFAVLSVERGIYTPSICSVLLNYNRNLQWRTKHRAVLTSEGCTGHLGRQASSESCNNWTNSRRSPLGY